MDKCCATDVYTCAKELRSLLVAHDNAVKKIAVLDGQIDQITRGLLLGDHHPHTSHASRCNIQLSVLAGVRHMLHTYRLGKHTQIQNLTRSIISTLSTQDSEDTSADRATEDGALMQDHLDLSSSSVNDLDLSSSVNSLDLSSSVSDLDLSTSMNDLSSSVNDRAFSPVTIDRAAINYTTLSREQYRTE